MKKIIILLIGFLGFLNLQAQAPLIPSVRCSLTTVTVFTDPYTVTGKTSDFSSNWQASDIAAGDSLYLLDGSELRIYRVVSISSASGVDFTIVIDDINNSGSVPVTGEYGVLYRGTTNYDFPNVTAGISETLQMAIQNRFVQRLDALLKGIGTDYITTDSFSTFTNSATFASIPLNKTVWRTTTGSKFEKTNSTTMTKRSTDNGELARLGLQGSGAAMTFNANLYNKVKVNTGDISATTIQNPTNFSTQEVGEVFLIGVTAGSSDVAVTWGDIYGTFNGSTFGAMPSTSIPAQMTIYFKFRVITPSVETVKFQYVDGGGGGTATKFPTLDSYTELRAFTGTDTMVFVNDFTYTYNSVSYTTLGGFFRRGSVGLAENGGTVIVANNSQRWVRVYDGTTYMPDWWEVGGKNVAGQAIAYIATDCMRIDACSRTAGQGATILFTGRVINDCDQSVVAQQGQRWIGQNCTTVLRAAPVKFTRLTANANAGVTSMSVTDTTGFRIGQTLLLRKQRGYSLSLQNAVTITAKSAGTITFTPALANNFTTNDTVVVVNRLISATGTSSMKSLPISFTGIEFDGNWRSRRLVNSWSYNEVIEASSFNLYYDNCNFVNMPAACVFLGKGEFNNCRWGAAATNSPATEKRMAGGLSHCSNSLITEHHTYVYRNCVSDSTNQVLPSVLGHESALFNFSSNVAFFTVEGGSYRNGGGGILWSDNNDWKFSVTGNCYFKNFTSIIRSSTASGAANSQGDIIIDGGLYEDCGDVVFTTVDATQYRNITVRNMRVFNGRIMLNGINQLQVENNHFVEKRAVVGTSPFATDLGAFAALTTRSMMWLQKVSNANIINNVLTVDSIYNTNVLYGIHFPTTGMTTINSGRDYFQQNINVQGNTLRNFRYGIGTQFGGLNNPETVRRVNWTYRGNTVVTQSHTEADGFGIQAAPGVVVTNNIIYDMNTGTTSYGLVVSGVDDSGPNENGIEGGIAYGNTVLGRSGTNILIGAAITTVNEHNALCFNNVSLTTPINNTTNQSPNLPNIVLDATIAPTLNSYQLPLFLNFR